MAKVRINKLLADAGVASRRAVEEMIAEGRITVNGKLVIELPCFVEATDKIVVDGRTVKFNTGPKRYFLLNKPPSVVCTSSDELGRKRAIDCIPDLGERVYCVGRLDADSTGVILLTNDGDLTQHMTHPKFGVVKTYRATIVGRVSGERIEKFKQGVFLDGRKTAGAMIRVKNRTTSSTVLEIRLTEGRNREIRRVLAKLGHKVKRLHRTAIGPIGDRGLGVGSWRELSANEVAQLRDSGGFESKKGAAPPPGTPARKTAKLASKARAKKAYSATTKKTLKKKIVKKKVTKKSVKRKTETSQTETGPRRRLISGPKRRTK
jgi:23S rRNA pseudouridine2605 synthase